MYVYCEHMSITFIVLSFRPTFIFLPRVLAQASAMPFLLPEYVVDTLQAH